MPENHRTLYDSQNRKFAPRILCVAISVWLIMTASTAWCQGDPVFDAKGLQPNRVYVSELPIEHSDPATGSLILTFTGLVLPGRVETVHGQRTIDDGLSRDPQIHEVGDLSGR